MHARGSAAHGYFQVYESMAKYTKAGFLQDPALRTPVFVRFSTVAGSRGSTDLARDVRGFSVKFYTEVLGFDVTTRLGTQAVFLSVGGYHHHIGLNTWSGIGVTPPPRGHSGLYHFAILFP